MRNKIAFIILIAAFASCSKFEDGPAISFRSKENRLIGKWKLTKWTENGQDVTILRTDSSDLFYEFVENKSMYKTIGTAEPIEGTWQIEERNVIMDLQLESEFGNYIDKDTLMLKRLTNREMTVYLDDEAESELFFEAQ